jgi:hypothetical protein
MKPLRCQRRANSFILPQLPPLALPLTPLSALAFLPGITCDNSNQLRSLLGHTFASELNFHFHVSRRR